MSPGAVEARSPIASQKNPTESRPSSGFGFGEVLPGFSGGIRPSASGKSRPRLVKVRRHNPRSRSVPVAAGAGFNPFGCGAGDDGFGFGADRSGESEGFVFSSNEIGVKSHSCVEKEESFAKKSSNEDGDGGNNKNGSETGLDSESCSTETTEVSKADCSSFVFGSSWLNSESNSNSGKRVSSVHIGVGSSVETDTSGGSRLDKGATPFVFGSSSDEAVKVGYEAKLNGERFESFCNGNVETPVNNSNDNSANFSSSGASSALPDEMSKLNIDDSEKEKPGISNAGLFSSSGNSSKSEGRRKTTSCDKSSKGPYFDTAKVDGNISCDSKLNGVFGTSGAESFTFQAGLGEVDKVDQIHKGQGVDNTEPSVSFSYEMNHTKSSASIPDEFEASSTDCRTPLCNPGSLRESLFPKLDKKMDIKNRSMKDKRLKDTRRNLKKPIVKKRHDQENASKESSFPDETNTHECFSPMDFSPYKESTVADQHPKETPSTPIQSNIHSKSPSVSMFGHNHADVAAGESAANFSWLGDNTKSYMFSATPAEQSGPSVRRHRFRRKSRIGVGDDTFVVKPRTKINPELSSVQSPPHARNAVDKAETGSKFKQEESSADEVHQTCEHWRIRGNEAFKKGDLSKAETFYTQGIVCVPSNERSGNSLEPLLLCFSNRAAARLRLQRVREAIGDCMTAIALDPYFLKAHWRAANCHLLLGEIEHARLYFCKCLEIGAGVCLDRTIILDAADGQQKAQKVVECIEKSTKFLEEKSHDAALSSLEIISEALSICPHSEKSLKLKTEALITLRRHEEAIQLCEQSLSFAEKNVTSVNPTGSYSFVRLWRWFAIAKSYFLLGRVEAALPLLDKLKQVGSVGDESARKVMESATSLETTIRGLLHTKNAGNEAFKSGRYSEAVDHYTVALSSNFESRHFVAICFCNRAAAHQALGQIADAIADCSLAIALDGNYRKAVSRRASLHEMIRDYGGAAIDLQRLISILESQPHDKSKEPGSSGRSTGGLKELRQAQMRLPLMEHEAKSGISLDFYLILGSKSDDTSADIKKAYRKAALKHHPDKAGQFLARSDCGDEGRLWKEIYQEVHKDADRLFKMIGEAYAVLSDSSKRAQYDIDEELRKALKDETSTQRSKSNSYTRSDFQSCPFESSYERNFRDHWKTHGSSYSRW